MGRSKALHTEIETEVLLVLESLEYEGTAVRITATIDRKQYLKVNEVLESAGGKWNKKAKAHLFDVDPRDKIQSIIQTGTFTSEHAADFFETPDDLADALCEGLDLKPDSRVLEPSAGKGSLISAVLRICPTARISAFELREDLVGLLQDRYKGVSSISVFPDDFLKVKNDLNKGTFDVVVMNPPFSGQADIDHVKFAATFVKSGGELRAIMSASVQFRTNRKTTEFLSHLESSGNLSIEPIDPEQYEFDGTKVRTVMLKWKRSK